jgi:TrmH family RNA methyltransferase
VTDSETTADGRRILGPKNPRVVELRRLIGRRSSRSVEIVLEGPRTIAEAIDTGLAPSIIVVPEGAADDPSVYAVLDRVADSAEVLVLRDKAFVALAPSVTPQPMLAVVDRPTTTMPDRLGAGDIVLVLIEIGDPGNVGTLVRVADAVAATCVVVVGGADPWGPKAVRASAGSMVRVPVFTEIDAATALGSLRVAGARIVGTDVREGEPHDSGVLGAPVAIVLGSEPHGLDRSIAPLVDAWTRIEMPGPTESLNVAMAGTLLAYEARSSAASAG